MKHMVFDPGKPITYTLSELNTPSFFERLFNPLAEYNVISSKIEYCKRHNVKVPKELTEMLEALEREIKHIINS